jgi:Cdc6-like AAA superfamily ATPase
VGSGSLWRIGDAQVPLVGRAEELRVLAALVSAARDGSGGSLVVRGDPGIGKTSLVRAATAQLADVLLLSVDGFESESTLPFAGVQRIGCPSRTSSTPCLPASRRHCGSPPAMRPVRLLTRS